VALVSRAGARTEAGAVSVVPTSVVFGSSMTTAGTDASGIATTGCSVCVSGSSSSSARDPSSRSGSGLGCDCG